MPEAPRPGTIGTRSASASTMKPPTETARADEQRPQPRDVAGASEADEERADRDTDATATPIERDGATACSPFAVP